MSLLDEPVLDATGLGGKVDPDLDEAACLAMELHIVFLVVDLVEGRSRSAVVFQLPKFVSECIILIQEDYGNAITVFPIAGLKQLEVESRYSG